MSVRHHPEDALLLAHATGGQDPATRMIVAVHLSCCARCRSVVRLAEGVGGMLLEDQKPVAMSPDALASAMSRLGKAETMRPRIASRDGTPPPLRAFLGRDLSEVRWRRLGRHLSYVTLYRRGPLAMRLLRATPGADVGHHRHRGTELTLVLRGGYSDETGSYGPGDFQEAGAELLHNPVADPGEDCINLSVTIGRLRFRNPVQTFVAGLFGF